MPCGCDTKRCQTCTPVSPSREGRKLVALIGNPNCGKTTLFNALTGARQHVGNWPGVTVERVSGYFEVAGTQVEIVDLPGTYSLTLASDDDNAMDECIACDFILNQEADVIVNVVDASSLERHLYLTLQLIEMGAPVIVALNMMDVAASRHQGIEVAKLASELGCPVIVLTAHKRYGLSELRRAIITYEKQQTLQKRLPYPEVIQQAIAEIAKLLPNTTAQDKFALSLRLLESDTKACHLVPETIFPHVTAQQEKIKQVLHEDADILIADARYRYIQALLAQALSVGNTLKRSWTERIDRVVLNRFLGIPIFLGMMYLLFVLTINVGGFFQNYFDLASQAVFVNTIADVLNYAGAPAWLTVLLANGVGKGLNTVITFIPVIGAMFLFLSLLEESGYMARASFVIDRLMCALGLPGKAFVPMIIGFGCNVPAVMAARTLESKRDRILTIMMSPFMSCSARLTIYAVFAAAFFPHNGPNVVFALYVIGIVMAMLTGFILRRTMLPGQPSALVMELPAYHLPHLKGVLIHAWQRLKGFVFRASKLIVPVCICIGVLNSVHIDGGISIGDNHVDSVLSAVGRFITPIFSPLGIHADNWPATVGLVTGVLAKEVVVGTLNTLYTQIGHVSTEAGVYGLMYQQFDGQIGAFAYLLFVLLYFPCISTLAVMLRELPRGWAYFSAFWMTSVAYGVAVIFYQGATIFRHPLSSTLWISAMLTIFAVTIVLLRWFAKRDETAKITMKPAYEGASA